MTARRWRVVAISVGIVALLLVIFLPPVVSTTRAAQRLQNNVQKAQRLIVAQRFSEADAAVTAAQADLAAAKKGFSSLRFWRWVPVLGSNIRAVDQLFLAGGTALQAIERITTFSRELLGPLSNRHSTISYGGLSVAERTGLLQRLGQAEPTLSALQTDVALFAEQIDAIPRSYVKSRIEKELKPFRDNFTLIQEGLDRAAPLARVLPAILGYGQQKTYLFLLQNNAELRPSGGFIGTYGVMKVNDGEFTSFETENSYTLDDRAKATLNTTAPEPLRRYNSAEKWFFRDANWSPDFPTAADQARRLYQLEGGTQRFNGVLAVTPTFIESLLRVTGPLTVDGVTFTAENFSDTLQDEVTFDFGSRGVGVNDRKNIIGDLGKLLMSKILNLPQTSWRDLWREVLTQLNEKHVLLTFDDTALQSFANEQGWDGSVDAPDGDSLLVVDANMASLKTDPVMQRAIEYRVQMIDGHAQATVKVTYTHTGDFNRKTTRYRTYTRVYVPKGSTLVSSEGADLTDRSNRAGTVTTTSELDHTVFALFKSIEPKTTESFTLTYRLPDRILTTEKYTLLVQKQAGVIATDLSLNIQLNRPIRLSTGIDRNSHGDNTLFAATTPLRQDRRLELTFD